MTQASLFFVHYFLRSNVLVKWFYKCKQFWYFLCNRLDMTKQNESDPKILILRYNEFKGHISFFPTVFQNL